MDTCNLDKLLNETLDALWDSRETYGEIAAGAGLTHSWVAKFSQEKIPNPGIRNLILLRNYLKKQQAA